MIIPFPTIRPSIRQSFRLQNTIADRVSLSGFGFWTGEDVTLQFRPARPHSGIVFVRCDFDGHPSIPARIEYREEKPRQTSLVKGNVRVDMVEHLLAAIKALQIDNLEIWTNKPEMPGLDGSSLPFIEALRMAGIAEQPAVRAVRAVTESFRIGDDTHYLTLSPSANGKNSYRYSLVPEKDYPLEPQEFDFDLTSENFIDQISGSRTFVSKSEADYLLSQGLCKRVTEQDVLILTPDGLSGNEYRYEDECARHKVLDMVGDFSLVAYDIVGTIHSFRGSHSLNAEGLRQLEQHSMFLDDAYISEHNEIFCCEEEKLKVA